VGIRSRGLGFRVLGFGFSGLKVWCLEFGVRGSVFGVWGLVFWGRGLGVGVRVAVFVFAGVGSGVRGFGVYGL